MAKGGFESSDSDGYVYRVTRQKAEICYYHHEGQKYFNPTFVPKPGNECRKEIYEIKEGHKGYPRYTCWATHTKLCSKRSATQQLNHLVKKDGTQRYPNERLVTIERAPFSLFQDVTQALINDIKP